MLLNKKIEKYALVRSPGGGLIWNELPFDEHLILNCKYIHHMNINKTIEATVHRVDVSNKVVEIYTWGFGGGNEMLADEGKRLYSSVDSLPKWMQSKLSVLMSIDHTKQNEELEGIGRRVSGHVFWVYPYEGESLDDAGSQGKGDGT